MSDSDCNFMVVGDSLITEKALVQTIILTTWLVLCI